MTDSILTDMNKVNQSDFEDCEMCEEIGIEMCAYHQGMTDGFDAALAEVQAMINKLQ